MKLLTILNKIFTSFDNGYFPLNYSIQKEIFIFNVIFRLVHDFV